MNKDLKIGLISLEPIQSVIDNPPLSTVTESKEQVSRKAWLDRVEQDARRARQSARLEQNPEQAQQCVSNNR